MNNLEIKKYIFSGHDSFQCRDLWLKKGFDFIKNGHSFTDTDAVVKLGVGKNMVSSIKFWLKAFNIIDLNDQLTDFSVRLFDDENGYDPFLEDEASLWLLHYQLIKNRYASTYTILFNDFRKEKMFFSKKVFTNYIRRIWNNKISSNYNENTINRDFGVFTNLYKSNDQDKSLKDSYSGILSEIQMLKNNINSDQDSFYIENSERDNLDESIVLFAILDNENYGDSISLNSLEFDIDSPGSIFALNRSGLLNKIGEIVSNSKSITFTDQAGLKELQFKKKPNKFKVLDKYYGK